MAANCPTCSSTGVLPASSQMNPYNPGLIRAPQPGGLSAPSNCQEGGLLTFSANITILAGSTGLTFATQATAAGVPGDHVSLEPFGNARMRIHALLMDGGEAAVTGLPIIDVTGYGQINHNGKEVRPTMRGSFANHVNCARATLCDTYLKCGINVLDPFCLPDFGQDDPLEISLSNTDGANDQTVCLTVVLEYVTAR